jgi:NADH-quinone oxidoreductase subunit L
MLRLVALTFWGTFRGTKEQEAQVHESPRSMTVPLVILAFLSVVGGYIGLPIAKDGDRIGKFLAPILLPLAGAETHGHEAAVSQELLLMAASVAVALAGLALAFFWYAKGNGEVPAKLAAAWPGVYRAVANKYYVDEVYDAVFVEGLAKGGGRLLWDVDATVVDGAVNGVALLTRGLSWISSAFDQYVVDGAVNGVADTIQAAFRVSRKAQTGRVQNYALVMGAGLFCIVMAYLLFR